MYGDAYDLVSKHPGIDTPLICLTLHQDEWGIRPTHPEPSELAGWLMKHYPQYWEATCRVIDRLIEEGKVVFMDSGKLYPVGYTGEIPELEEAS